MKKLIIFNWKMNPLTFKEAKRIFNSILYPKKAELVIAPPFIYLNDLKVKNKNSKIRLAAQDVFWENQGAYMGEISPTMLKNLDVEYVIIGHAERRKYLGETDEMINKKVLAALKTGLRVVLCVGENLKIHKKDRKIVEKFIKSQLAKDLRGLTQSYKLKAKKLIVAYDPIWAIGTGRPCPPEDASKMIKFIKRIMAAKYKLQTTKVIYGGSVDSKNIKNFVKYKEIDGALVGGASLRSKEVKKIIQLL